MDENWPPDLPTHWMVYFAVEDADAATKKVTELGGTVHMPPRDIPVGRFAVVQDPTGATFSLIKLDRADD
jgi:predicted enzyme related to lactoylglutathione lyase